MSHATREIPVGGADALHGSIHAAEGIHGSPEAGCAGGVLRHAHTGAFENVPNALSVPEGFLELTHHGGGGRHPEGVDLDRLAANHLGKCQEVAELSAGAGTDVGAIELHVAHFLGEFTLARIGMAGDGRLEFGEIEHLVVNEALVGIEIHRLEVGLGAVGLHPLGDVVDRLLVARENAVLAAGILAKL